MVGGSLILRTNKRHSQDHNVVMNVHHHHN